MCDYCQIGHEFKAECCNFLRLKLPNIPKLAKYIYKHTKNAAILLFITMLLLSIGYNYYVFSIAIFECNNVICAIVRNTSCIFHPHALYFFCCCSWMHSSDGHINRGERWTSWTNRNCDCWAVRWLNIATSRWWIGVEELYHTT